MSQTQEPIAVPNFEVMQDPYPLYAQLAERGPVVRMRTHRGLEVYGVMKWDTALAALRDPRIAKSAVHLRAAFEKAGVSGPGAGSPIAGADVGNLLNTDPPDHTRLRNLVNLAFSPRRIELLRTRVEALVDRLIEPLKSRAQADMLADFAYPIGITMICEMLGVPEDGRGNFRDWATKTMSPGHAEQGASRGLLMSYLKELIAQKRTGIAEDSSPDAQPDVLSAMIAARLSKDALTEDEVLGMSFLILSAGHETTVGLIGNTMRLLALHPEQRDRLVRSPELIKGTIEEVLRFDGPVHWTTMRATSEAMTLGGVVIPEHSFVQINLAGCNRDPARFSEPNKFDIGRTPSQTLAFGFGPHFCLGQHLAKLEAMTAIGRVVAAFPALRLDCAPDEVPWAPTVIRAPASLPMQLTA